MHLQSCLVCYLEETYYLFYIIFWSKKFKNVNKNGIESNQDEFSSTDDENVRSSNIPFTSGNSKFIF